MNQTSIFLTGAALLATLACGGGAGGGGSTGTPAARLTYTLTAQDTWRLVEDAASTDTLKILDLMAPSNASGNGVCLTLTTNPAQAGWAVLSPSSAGARYALQTLFASPTEYVATVGGSGAELHILLAQVPGGTLVSYGSVPVVQVALQKASSATVGSVPLAASDSGHLGSAATPEAITVDVGSLQAVAP